MYVIAFQNTRDKITTTARCALQPAQLEELSFLEKGLDLITMFPVCLLSTIQFAGQAYSEFLLSRRKYWWVFRPCRHYNSSLMLLCRSSFTLQRVSVLGKHGI